MKGTRSILAVVVLCTTQSWGAPSTPGNDDLKKTEAYNAARWDPIHFKPAIDQATDEQCLSCHQEILDRRVLAKTPAGVPAEDTLAWYQTLNTYEGPQETFHRRHLVMPLAKKLMKLKCNTCHQGNDPREEVSGSSATTQPGLTMRKMVDPQVCLMCHGKFPAQVMGIPGDWYQSAKLFNNDCLTCHKTIRTHRHQVNFLKPEAIEKAGAQDSDVCFGCHGGRAWFRVSYPYPRHPWPGAQGPVPEWAKDRPTDSAPRFRLHTGHEAQPAQKQDTQEKAS